MPEGLALFRRPISDINNINKFRRAITFGSWFASPNGLIGTSQALVKDVSGNSQGPMRDWRGWLQGAIPDRSLLNKGAINDQTGTNEGFVNDQFCRNEQKNNCKMKFLLFRVQQDCGHGGGDRVQSVACGV